MESPTLNAHLRKPMQREVAHKTWISNLLNGSFVRGQSTPDHFVPSYMDCKGKKISRVNIVATVVDVYKNNDGKYASVTLDDGSATIRVKAFNEDIMHIEHLARGEMVLLIARVREYQEEVYLLPEVAKQLTDLNIWLVRRAELIKHLGFPDAEEKKVGSDSFAGQVQEIAVGNMVGQVATQAVSAPPSGENEELRQKVISILEAEDSTGAEISLIAERLETDDETAEQTVKELLLEGEIYENKPGHYKVI